MTRLTPTPTQAEFIDSVVRLQPRVATFDCDGTLWSGDAGEGFFSWELKQGLLSEDIRQWAVPRYAAYKADKVPEEIMCGEMVTLHRGLREGVVQQAADTYFPQEIAPNIFPEMRDLIRHLRDNGCDVWAVSSSNQWIIRAGMRYFDIPPDRILAAETAVEDGIIVDRIIRVPSGPGKPVAIREAVTATPDCAFGNSIWDREMLAMSKHPFAVNPNPNLKEIAITLGWTIYQPNTNHSTR